MNEWINKSVVCTIIKAVGYRISVMYSFKLCFISIKISSVLHLITHYDQIKLNCYRLLIAGTNMNEYPSVVQF